MIFRFPKSIIIIEERETGKRGGCPRRDVARLDSTDVRAIFTSKTVAERLEDSRIARKGKRELEKDMSVNKVKRKLKPRIIA